ncbi:MAG: hypothetical protein RL163_297, partial [Pseudomonadota bacterium]
MNLGRFIVFINQLEHLMSLINT